jgi:hypothetical protein
MWGSSKCSMLDRLSSSALRYLPVSVHKWLSTNSTAASLCHPQFLQGQVSTVQISPSASCQICKEQVRDTRSEICQFSALNQSSIVNLGTSAVS